MKVFDAGYLDELSCSAKNSPRKRQHRNIHQSFHEPCQRMYNAIEPGSYIRPHKHASDPRDELLIAIRGLMVLVTFDEQGTLVGSLPFGSEKYGSDMAIGAELPSNTWHTVIALEPGSVLLESKAGPFDPNQPKDLASWAPEEGTSSAEAYLRELVEQVAQFARVKVPSSSA